MGCDEVTRALSDGDGRVIRRRDVRAHLRACADCRAFREEIKGRRRDLAAISPLPVAAVAGMLKGLVGGSGAAGGGGLATMLGGGAAKTISASAAAKGVATIAVAAAVGVGAADRTGVIHLGLPGEGKSQPASSVPPAPPGGHPGAAGSEAPASAPGQAGAGKEGAGHHRAGSGNSQGTGAKGAGAGDGQEHGEPPTDRGHEMDSAGGTRAPGAPPGHAVGHGQEKQLPDSAATGQEKAAEQGSPERETGDSAKPESPPADKPSKPEQAQSNSPPGQEAKEPPANPSPAAPESPGQGPPQGIQPGAKGSEHAAPGSAAGSGEVPSPKA